MAEEMSFEDEILKLINAEPFVPFTVIVTSGDRYRVIDANRVAFGGSAVAIFEPREGLSVFRKNQVVAVEQRSSRNGRRRKK
jgi:hypothetical protein